MANTITFVSLGPGEPDLITLKGLKKLQEADIIFCPFTLLKSGKQSSRAQDMLLALGIQISKIRLFDVPMSKNRKKALHSYQQVAMQIEAAYLSNQNVAVTAEGDTSFYSSGHYIIDLLAKKGLAVDKVPGVPAFISAGALAHLHIVQQEEQLHVVPGVITATELGCKLEAAHTVLIMKASQCQDIIKQLIQQFPTHTFHYFENIGLETEYYTTIQEEILNRQFPYFSLLIIKPLI